ncbi:ArdC family protein [Methylobacterium radiotolerans]|uniref:ArdC family protein n=1 Tax=Methylobacterium radiotolerans TaxID=31998 RepID=UPI001EECC5E0|nr:zincin-like metallopeptidase domain-containing protein [Methylobacterium radiotolerans]UIY45824.1 ssDNA-binding domain-containing protein [Methylobacterium radiotolerans]
MRKPASTTATAPRADIYETVTETIATALERAASPTEWPWVKAAGNGVPVNARTRKPYTGINRLLLGIAGMAGASRYWATFNQWKELNAKVIKGSKGTVVTFWGEMYVDRDTRQRCDKNDPNVETILYCKPSYVFNASQVEGWTAPAEAAASNLGEVADLAEVEAFVIATGARVTNAGDQAFYSPAADTITMPTRDRFKDTASASATAHYYGVLMHELVHWTGGKGRCDRDLSGRFGDAAYAFEELVAEIGSAFLCGDLGISPQPRADNVEYVRHWLKVLRDDKKAIFTAASLSRKAAEALHAMQPALMAEAA